MEQRQADRLSSPKGQKNSANVWLTSEMCQIKPKGLYVAFKQSKHTIGGPSCIVLIVSSD